MDFEVNYPTKVFVAALRNVATLPHAALCHCTPQCCYVTARSITSLHSAVLLRYHTQLYVTALRSVATLPHAALRHCTPQCCYVTTRSFTSLHSAVLLGYHTQLYVTALRSVATLPYAAFCHCLFTYVFLMSYKTFIKDIPDRVHIKICITFRRAFYFTG